MEFVQFDSGVALRNERGGHRPKILRLLVGNPLIMKEMARTDPHAAAYAPVTILVDERADGVHLSYDLMTSLIAPDGSEATLVVARDLDAKIERLLDAAARGQTEDGETSDARGSSGEVQELGRTDDRLIGEREHGRR